MTKEKKLVWRLTKLPTTEELRELVKDKIISQEEAREILFSEQETRDEESLKSEIKFLRELVDKISDKQTVIKQIGYIQQPYYNYDWYKPYTTWCDAGNTTLTVTGTNSVAYLSTSSSISDINNF